MRRSTTVEAKKFGNTIFGDLEYVTVRNEGCAPFWDLKPPIYLLPITNDNT